ncbi:flagellar motor switch protein FliG [Endothiovibrio diazotrophicus]
MSEQNKPPIKLSGAERAAVLLMSLGEHDAAEVLKHLNPKEVQKVGMTMSSLTNVSKDDVDVVVDNFLTAVGHQTGIGVGSEDYIRKVLIAALGEDKAAGMIDRIMMGREAKGLETLKWMDPRAVAEVIRNEHPQIIATILSYLEEDHSAEILSHLPERTRPDLIMRIASLDRIQPSALQELDIILERQFSGGANAQASSVGGVKKAADILNFVEGSIEAEIMSSVKDVDADLGQQIADLMFVFDNLADVDDRGIQMILREVPSETLLLALKGADEPVKEKIFKNMSKRASEMLRDDLEAKGPVRLSEVEQAQKEVLAIARRMADAGEISLGGKGDAYV